MVKLGIMNNVKPINDIIKNDVKKLGCGMRFYPVVEEIKNSSNFVSVTLLYFLKNLISCKVRSLLISSIV